MSSLIGTSVSGCSEFSLFAEGSKSSYTNGNVRTFLCDNRLLLTGVEHGTASRWWELLGRAGIQFAFFCLGSLYTSDQYWFLDIKPPYFWCDDESVLMETALNLSSLPSKMSSTSDALSRVMFVAKLWGPSPTIWLRLWLNHINCTNPSNWSSSFLPPLRVSAIKMDIACTKILGTFACSFPPFHLINFEPHLTTDLPQIRCNNILHWPPIGMVLVYHRTSSYFLPMIKWQLQFKRQLVDWFQNAKMEEEERFFIVVWYEGALP